MARQIVLLALIFFAIVGAVSAKETVAAKAPAPAPTADVAEEAAGAPSVGAKGETIGELDANAPTDPMGPAAAEAMGPSGDGKSSACALKVSAAIAGVAAVAGFLSF